MSDHDENQLPKLRGSKKQLGWAYKIRAALAVLDPTSELLTKELEAQFWIDNRSILGEVNFPKTLPQLSGTEAHIKWAFAIRSKLADIFPEMPVLRSQTDAKFWIENRRMFDFAVLGFKLAPVESANKQS